MNLTLNRLPTRTWNHLGMNQTDVSLEGEYTNHTPKAAWDPAEVLFDPAAQWAGPEADAELTAVTAGADTALVETQPGTAMAHPILLHYTYAAGERGASRLVFHAAKGSTLTAVLMLSSADPEAAGLSAIQIEIRAEENAKVQLYTAQLLNRNSICLHEIRGVCADSAVVSLTKLELGSSRTYASAVMDLKGRESAFNTNIGYHVRGGHVLDMNYVALHHGPKTNSLMEVSGTLDEGSRKVFRGTIDFQQGCAGAKGTENENVLLLGDNMVNQTIPLILCKEEDVEGNHGASIGRLDERMLFYLGARGISEEAAQEIIARSRIDVVCDTFPDADIREQIRSFEH